MIKRWQPRSLSAELLLCQRYFEVLGGEAVNTTFGFGAATTTSAGYTCFPMVTKRIIPAIIATQPGASYNVINGAGAVQNLSSFATNATFIGTKIIVVNWTAAAATMVAAQGTVMSANSQAAQIQLSAEL